MTPEAKTRPSGWSPRAPGKAGDSVRGGRAASLPQNPPRAHASRKTTRTPHETLSNHPIKQAIPDRSALRTARVHRARAAILAAVVWRDATIAGRYAPTSLARRDEQLAATEAMFAPPDHDLEQQVKLADPAYIATPPGGAGVMPGDIPFPGPASIGAVGAAATSPERGCDPATRTLVHRTLWHTTRTCRLPRHHRLPGRTSGRAASKPRAARWLIIAAITRQLAAVHPGVLLAIAYRCPTVKTRRRGLRETARRGTPFPTLYYGASGAHGGAASRWRPRDSCANEPEQLGQDDTGLYRYRQAHGVVSVRA